MEMRGKVPSPAPSFVPGPLLTLSMSKGQLGSSQELGCLEEMGLAQRGSRQLVLENSLAYHLWFWVGS